jgi:hypothetical protein
VGLGGKLPSGAKTLRLKTTEVAAPVSSLAVKVMLV